jgi:TetR/AcrR family transcriptional repressor of bet genes
MDKRAASRARRRQQLVDATIKCIARKGIGATTLADVAGQAGLSQGIVNLHFDSKDNLLAETLRYLAEDYDQQFMQTLEKTAGSAADKLLALMDLDLRPSICDRQKLAVWFAFWGEVKAVPTYQKICAARDDKYHEVMMDLVAEIADDGGYENLNAEVVTEALSSMTDGLWLSCLINPKTFDRKTAREAVHGYLHATFPNHYPQGDV